jgi:hypothetical protein
MVICKVIREPSSLEAAKTEYERQVNFHGYVVVSDFTAYWQSSLFRTTMDAIVTANVEKGTIYG